MAHKMLYTKVERLGKNVKKIPCPGSKIRSKGKGRGKGFGKKKGPIGVPYDYKKR